MVFPQVFHTQKNVAIYWYNKLRQFSIIITWRHKISTHFPTGWGHSGFLPVVTFLSHFIKKTSVVANVNVGIIFYTPFCSKLFPINFVWKYLILDTLLLCPFISKSDSSAVESSPRIPWIEDSTPAETILTFQYRVEWILFPPKTVHFVPCVKIAATLTLATTDVFLMKCD